MIRVHTDLALTNHVNRNAPVEAPDRLAAALEGAERARNAGAELEFLSPQPAPRGVLEAVHEARYLDAVQALCGSGGGYLDPDTATNEHSWNVAALASGAAIAAVEDALSGTAAFALVRPPGHHAGGTTRGAATRWASAS